MEFNETNKEYWQYGSEQGEPRNHIQILGSGSRLQS